MHVQPLRGDDDDDHYLLLSTLTGGHGVFMAEAEVNKIEDWYDSDNEHYDQESDWQVPLYQSPLFNVHADQWICFQTLTWSGSSLLRLLRPRSVGLLQAGQH